MLISAGNDSVKGKDLCRGGVYYLKKRKFMEDIIAVLPHLKRCHEKAVRSLYLWPQARPEISEVWGGAVMEQLGLRAPKCIPAASAPHVARCKMQHRFYCWRPESIYRLDQCFPTSLCSQQHAELVQQFLVAHSRRLKATV